MLRGWPGSSGCGRLETWMSVPRDPRRLHMRPASSVRPPSAALANAAVIPRACSPLNIGGIVWEIDLPQIRQFDLLLRDAGANRLPPLDRSQSAATPADAACLCSARPRPSPLGFRLFEFPICQFALQVRRFSISDTLEDCEAARYASEFM